MTEEQLINGLKGGNESAFRQIVELFQKQAFNTCNSFVHNQQDADDLTQEVFIEVFRSANRFRGDSKLSTWIYRIAVNKSLNYLRLKKRRKWLQPIEDLFDLSQKMKPATDKGSNPSENIENQQLSIRLHKAIDSLSENQRTAFLLSKYEELSYQQIAEVMQTSLPAIESLIHRAKLNLQKILYNDYKKNAW